MVNPLDHPVPNHISHHHYLHHCHLYKVVDLHCYQLLQLRINHLSPIQCVSTLSYFDIARINVQFIMQLYIESQGKVVSEFRRLLKLNCL
jgi:hypothetical protein